jgi:hypothetical protein
MTIGAGVAARSAGRGSCRLLSSGASAQERDPSDGPHRAPLLLRRPRALAGGLDAEGRGGVTALMSSALRSQPERVDQHPDGLVRIALKKAYKDGTVAVAWTCSHSCAGSPPACRCRAFTQSIMPGSSPQRAWGARDWRRLCLRARRMSSPRGGCAGADIARGLNSYTNVRRGRSHLPEQPGSFEATRRGEEPCRRSPAPRGSVASSRARNRRRPPPVPPSDRRTHNAGKSRLARSLGSWRRRTSR